MPVIYLFNSIFLACAFSYCAFLCFACTVIFVPLLICFYTFVCRNKSSKELMLYMFKHVRQKIKFLNLNLNISPKSGKLPFFLSHLLPIILSLKWVNCIDFSNENALCRTSAKCSPSTITKICYNYLKSFKPLKRVSTSSCSKLQPRFKYWWTK